MRTVLVVDDEYGIVEVLVLALEDQGYRVLSAADGKEGLERLAESRPDLVMLDFMMPRMDGPAMAQAMRADPALRDIPIVMMSAVGEAPIRDRFTGYAKFLRKPFRIQAALDLVATLIGSAESGKAG
jgi:CheY-like chemotaxis protein